MKYFIGIKLPKSIVDQISETVTGLSDNFVKSRLEPHITLKGPQNNEDILLIESIVRSVANTFHPFVVSMTDVKMFGESHLVISAKSKVLHELNANFARSLEKFNNREVKNYDFNNYNPHITVSKISDNITLPKIKEVEKTVATSLGLPKSFAVTEICIFLFNDVTNMYDKTIDIPLEPYAMPISCEMQEDVETTSAPWNANFYEKVEDSE